MSFYQRYVADLPLAIFCLYVEIRLTPRLIGRYPFYAHIVNSDISCSQTPRIYDVGVK